MNKKTKIFCSLLFVSSILFGSEYELGEGYQLGQTPVYIGGYFSLDAAKYTNREKSHARIDDLAFLSYGSYDKFSYMAEFEFKEFYTKYWEGENTYSKKNTKLYTERLYLDYEMNENILLRGGKYNSNVGYWNLTPINVLRDTTSSPQTSQIIFPKYTTGVDLAYHIFSEDEYAFNLTLQDNNSLDEEYNNFSINKHIGAGVEYNHDNLSIKFNLGYFHKKDHSQAYSDNLYAYGSFLYDNDTLKLMGAVANRVDEKFNSLVKITGYLQGVYELANKHYPVIRIEYFDSNEAIEGITKDTSATLGYTYRPLYPVAFKVEYQLHSKHQENKFLTSFAVMF